MIKTFHLLIEMAQGARFSFRSYRRSSAFIGVHRRLNCLGRILKPLENRTILVTRPQHQSAQLAHLILASGGVPLLFPVIEIAPVEDTDRLVKLLDALDAFDLAIFVSANAAREGLAAIRRRREVPPALKFVAVGPGTAKALEAACVENVVAPSQRFDSEGLLELPELSDPRGRRVVIFRGEGGRETLGETLRLHGAIVEYAECYRRRRPRADAAKVTMAMQRNEIDAITVTSSEGLRTLSDLVAAEARTVLRATPLFVPHERIAQTALLLDFTAVVRTEPGDEGLVQGLIRWFEAKTERGLHHERF